MTRDASTSQPSRYATARDARIPLYVQVVTQPPLLDCWSMNISRTGIALQARAPAEVTGLEGSRLEVEFSLPDTGARLRALAEIAWRDERRENRSVSVGVRFVEISAEHRAILVRYLQEYRFRVAVGPADAADQAAVAEALGGVAAVLPASSEKHLDDILSRGDISVLVILGHDETAATALARRAARRAAAHPSAREAVIADMAPRVVYAARGMPENLVRLHNAGLVYQSIAHPPEAAALRSAVLRGCEDYSVRAELRRVSQELERALQREKARARAKEPGSPPLSRIVAASEPMRNALELLRTAASEKVVVLLQGETGTGKELLARALHDLSDRANAPFVAQDCGALTETLLESELFGHVRGAFTGAISDHPGLFVAAEGGTVFLDEIANTSPSLQAKLLRVIETGEVRPVGGTDRKQVDVRIVAASNRDLLGEANAGRFRADLFYRLNVFPIHVAPLRARSDDVLPLARRFLEDACAASGRGPRSLSGEAENVLLRHSWPGNVRELRNVIERAVLLSREPVIGPQLLVTGEAECATHSAHTLEARLLATERELVREALQAHGGVLRRAAQALGMDPVTLGRKARRHGLWPPGTETGSSPKKREARTKRR